MDLLQDCLYAPSSMFVNEARCASMKQMMMMMQMSRGASQLRFSATVFRIFHLLVYPG